MPLKTKKCYKCERYFAYILYKNGYICEGCYNKQYKRY